MARPARRRPFTAARGHADWLRLVEVSGPFLSLPVLGRVFPQGLPRDEGIPELRRRLRVALEGWEEARRDPAVHQAFVRHVLLDVLGWPVAHVKEGQALPPGLDVTIAEHGERLRPDLALLQPEGRPDAGKARVLVVVVPPGQELERAVEGRRWKASPATRAMELCHASEVPLAVVTNGAAWTLVHARRGETSTYVTFQAPLFLEEAGLLAAFRALLGEQRLLGVADADTLEALLAESAQNQQEVTDQLGLQVRRAVEVLVQSIDRSDRNAGGALLEGVDERTLYEGAVAAMMRLVFLLAAEERKLLLLGDPLYDAHYAVSTLLGQLDDTAAREGEEVLERRFAAWARLLATFRAVHGGVEHDRLRLPAYGGTLFDPDRFPFLEGRPAGSRWRETSARPIEISDRTVYQLLRKLQLLEMAVPGGGSEARRLSFRALDVEQIGHVYEGLLDHTAVRATEPVVGLRGTLAKEPELPLSALVEVRERGDDELVTFLQEETGRSASALRKAIAEASEEDREATSRLLQVCANDPSLRDLIRPWARLLREDAFGLPVVIRKGSAYVTGGSDRRSTGTHYTPRSLTEPVVQYALEPQVYRGPAEGWPREKWQLKSPRELLALRVCDMAMGSGAFLAQACRWLGDRLVEAWEEAEAAAGGKLVVTPEGDLATGAAGERPIPRNAEERITLARRAVAERCLYGVDVNPMAVEIAKLSLWLVTLQKDRPFTFVDHALRCGDSLLGVTSPEQVAGFHLDPEKATARRQDLFGWKASAERALKDALEKRRKLESFTAETTHDVKEKERLLAEASAALADARLVADAVVGAALATSDRGEDAYEAELDRLAPRIAAALDSKATPEGRAAARVEVERNLYRLLDAGRPPKAAKRRPFHWALEFPEVFAAAGGQGFQTVIGNPPFMTGTSIRGALGSDRRLLLTKLWAEFAGRADLCVAFLRRASDLNGPNGTTGILATNTVAETDSRLAGLAPLIRSGATVCRAVKSRPWPGLAAVYISEIVFVKGTWRGVVVLDGREVGCIDSNLTAGNEQLEPQQLAASAARSFTGTKVYGDGFVIAEEEARGILRASPDHSRVLKPFLVGRELNEDPELRPGRYIVDFTDMTEAGARRYEAAWRIVELRVKPSRASAPEQRMREVWWQFQRPRKELYARLEKGGIAWVIAATSDTVAFAGLPFRKESPWVISHAVNVMDLRGYSDFAALQGSLHAAWVRRRASSLKTDLRYTTTDCFNTFPLPGFSPEVERIGAEFHAMRAALMRKHAFGLTDIHARLHAPSADSRIGELRDAFVALDYAVLELYGWRDLSLEHGLHETGRGERFTICEAARREVLARLLKLNHERYAQEVKQGLHEKSGKKPPGGGKPRSPRGPRKPMGGDGQGSLL